MAVRDRKRTQQLDLELQFRPSRDTLLWWRFTRKAPAAFAGVLLPGLFHTVHFTRDTFLFFILLALETWGLYNFLIAGKVNILYIVVLFVIDVVLAVIRHSPVGRICELQNRLVYQDDAVQAAEYRRLIGHRQFFSLVISMLIILLAAGKMAGFYAVVGEINGLTIGVLVSYLLVALLQILVTGYFTAQLMTDFSLWLDRRSYIRKTIKGTTSPLRIDDTATTEFPSVVRLTQYQVGEHTLAARDDTTSPAARPVADATATSVPLAAEERTYVLRSWGVLSDPNLYAFINAQPTDAARAVLARAGVRHQVEAILEASATR
jgi:hypothetical protein